MVGSSSSPRSLYKTTNSILMLGCGNKRDIFSGEASLDDHCNSHKSLKPQLKIRLNSTMNLRSGTRLGTGSLESRNLTPNLHENAASPKIQ